jgi:putative FmdB family regulatory protein
VPTYQYACTECADELEVVQSFSDDPLTVCPACGGRLRKVFSPVGVVFKGSGFYKTDSRSAATTKKEPEKVGAESTSDVPAKPDAPAKADTPAKAETAAAPSDKPAKKESAPAA